MAVRQLEFNSETWPHAACILLTEGHHFTSINKGIAKNMLHNYMIYMNKLIDEEKYEFYRKVVP